MVKKTNVKKKVEWFSKKKFVIKFEDDDDTYSLAQNVIDASDFDKYPIEEDDIVEVGFSEDEDKIIFLRKQNKFAKNNEENSDESLNTEVITVLGIRKDRTAIKVGDNKWLKVKKSLQNNDNLKAKAKLTVKISDDTIVAIKKQATQPDSSSSELIQHKGNSIDNQSAVKSVAEIIKALIDNKIINSVDDTEQALIQLANVAKSLIVD